MSFRLATPDSSEDESDSPFEEGFTDQEEEEQYRDRSDSDESNQEDDEEQSGAGVGGRRFQISAYSGAGDDDSSADSDQMDSDGVYSDREEEDGDEDGDQDISDEEIYDQEDEEETNEYLRSLQQVGGAGSSSVDTSQRSWSTAHIPQQSLTGLNVPKVHLMNASLFDEEEAEEEAEAAATATAVAMDHDDHLGGTYTHYATSQSQSTAKRTHTDTESFPSRRVDGITPLPSRTFAVQPATSSSTTTRLGSDTSGTTTARIPKMLPAVPVTDSETMRAYQREGSNSTMSVCPRMMHGRSFRVGWFPDGSLFVPSNFSPTTTTTATTTAAAAIVGTSNSTLASFQPAAASRFGASPFDTGGHSTIHTYSTSTLSTLTLGRQPHVIRYRLTAFPNNESNDADSIHQIHALMNVLLHFAVPTVESMQSQVQLQRNQQLSVNNDVTYFELDSRAKVLSQCLIQLQNSTNENNDLLQSTFALLYALYGTPAALQQEDESAARYRMLCNWLRSTLSRSAAANPRASLLDVFHFLTCGQVEEAARLCTQLKYYRLATLVSQYGHRSVMKEYIRQQLQLWHKQLSEHQDTEQPDENSEFLSDDVLRIYHLLAGDIDSEFVCSRLDWLHAFAARVFYQFEPNTPLGVLLDSFTSSVSEGYTVYPVPPYIPSNQIPTDSTAQLPLDIRYHILSISEVPEYPLQSAFAHTSASPNPFDYLHVWICYLLLRALRVIPGKSDPRTDVFSPHALKMHVVSQLESVGQWQWALFVAVCHSDPEGFDGITLQLVRSLLSRHVSHNQPEEVDRFLIENLRISPLLVNEAKAVHALSKFDYFSEVRWLVNAFRLEEAHGVAMQHLLCDQIAGGNWDSVRELLENLSQFCAGQPFWRDGAGLLYEFFQIENTFAIVFQRAEEGNQFEQQQALGELSEVRGTIPHILFRLAGWAWRNYSMNHRVTVAEISTRLVEYGMKIDQLELVQHSRSRLSSLHLLDPSIALPENHLLVRLNSVLHEQVRALELQSEM